VANHNIDDGTWHKPERGIAIRVGVSGGDDGTMIEFTAIVPEYERRFLLNDILDDLISAGKRQRARAQLPELRHERDATAEILTENQTRLVAMDEEFRVNTDGRENEVLKARSQRDSLCVSFQDEWQSSGRRGEFEARGEQKLTLGKIDSFITGKLNEQTKANEEHKVARSQLENEIKKRATALQILDRRITECIALARGEDISGAGEKLQEARYRQAE
jgi:hypothetical protein